MREEDIDDTRAYRLPGGQVCCCDIRSTNFFLLHAVLIETPYAVLEIKVISLLIVSVAGQVSAVPVADSY